MSMNEQDLIQQLKTLPREIETKDQWEQIRQSIESQSAEREEVVTETAKPWRFPFAIAASVLMVAFLAVFIPTQDGAVGPDFVQQKTLQSLQQANSQYYSALGTKMKQEAAQMPAGVDSTLNNLRQAQKSYSIELAQSPNDTGTYKKLIKTYETEREILKRLLS